MAAAAAEAAGLEAIDLDQNLLELGLDSLRAAEFASQACTRVLVALDAVLVAGPKTHYNIDWPVPHVSVFWVFF